MPSNYRLGTGMQSPKDRYQIHAMVVTKPMDISGIATICKQYNTIQFRLLYCVVLYCLHIVAIQNSEIITMQHKLESLNIAKIYK